MADLLAPRPSHVRGAPRRGDRDGTSALREATAADVPALVALLTDDPLGATRESADPAPHETAFAAVDADPAHLLVASHEGFTLEL